MDEIQINIDDKNDQNNVLDTKFGNDDKKENITYVAISPGGSIVATFDSCCSFIRIKRVVKNEKNSKAKYSDVKITEIKTVNPPNVLGWSLAVSDTIDNDMGFVAISCIAVEDMNPKGIEEVNIIRIILYIAIQSSKNLIKLFIPYCLILFFLIFIIFLSLPIPWSTFLLCIFVSFNLYYFIRLCMLLSYYVTNKDDTEQFRLSWISSKGMLKIFKFSLNDNKYEMIHESRLGGVINFLKNSKNSATLVCTNCIKIQKIIIKLNKNIPVSEEQKHAYLLPENLYKELESGDKNVIGNIF
ncbi:hypothetical protein RclHR1_16410003 [Rhizophagus clarus]|uniref:Uncharacterized protein n=1 Tax=Rhizophagus clarus TaxID=94130 RepID=A0A2Z6QHM0_9GLOM|nr:hypothetical protein RclHR1_16410003 [Rhizophagus clarus]GES90885.1 hypothetical protein GLOIN_2v1484628 [Rhizophagus clarus]